MSGNDKEAEMNRFGIGHGQHIQEDDFYEIEDGKNSEPPQSQLHKHTSPAKSTDSQSLPLHNPDVRKSVISQSYQTNIDAADYILSIKETLKNEKKLSNYDLFERLYRLRYACEPQIDVDETVVSKLCSSGLSKRDFMVLTQKHFNDFGGFVIDYDDDS